VKGWSWKKVTIWTHKPGNVWEAPVASVIYQPSDRTAGAGVKGDVCLALTGQKCVSCPGNVCPPIELGTDYDFGYLSMQVWTDGCDDTKMDSGFTRSPLGPPSYVSCTALPAGRDKTTTAEYKAGSLTTFTLYTNKNPVQIAPSGTNTPVTGTPPHLYVNGSPIPLDTAGSLLKYFDCTKNVTQGWEDTLKGPTSDYAWETQDFNFRVETECAPNPNFTQGGGTGGMVRLTK